MCTSWTPFSLTKSPYAVVVLNRPITIPTFEAIWNEATIRICVDGGTNRLFELKTKIQNLKDPDLITGDFDSIQEAVKTHYEKLGVKIVHTEDQNYTDFTKALMTVEVGIATGEFPQVDSFIAVVDSGGRMDQMFSNICTLFKTNVKVYLSCEDTISWLLKPGTHSIVLSKEYIASKPHCGLIPLCGPTKMKSKGLTWDLNGEYHFHGILSTNNISVATVVEIETEKETIWTMDALWTN